MSPYGRRIAKKSDSVASLTFSPEFLILERSDSILMTEGRGDASVQIIRIKNPPALSPEGFC